MSKADAIEWLRILYCNTLVPIGPIAGAEERTHQNNVSDDFLITAVLGEVREVDESHIRVAVTLEGYPRHIDRTEESDVPYPTTRPKFDGYIDPHLGLAGSKYRIEYYHWGAKVQRVEGWSIKFSDVTSITIRTDDNNVNEGYNVFVSPQVEGSSLFYYQKDPIANIELCTALWGNAPSPYRWNDDVSKFEVRTVASAFAALCPQIQQIIQSHKQKL